jgi:hypothetical protein
VIAAPDFDLAEQITGSGTRQLSVFSPLEGAADGGRQVARRLGVSPLLGANALESTVREVKSPLILHLATHGFFVPPERYEGRPDVFESITAVCVSYASTMVLSERGTVPGGSVSGARNQRHLTRLPELKWIRQAKAVESLLFHIRI